MPSYQTEQKIPHNGIGTIVGIPDKTPKAKVIKQYRHYYILE